MKKSNTRLKRAVTDMDRDAGPLFVEFIKEVADRRGSELRNRTDLFYQTEPFAREFDEYGLLDPGDRDNWHGYTMNNRLSAIAGQSKIMKYRTMFFAWLSYYHPKDAKALCEKIGHDIPMYEGHPDLSDCSDEAKEWFVKQPRVDEAPASPEDNGKAVLPPVMEEEKPEVENAPIERDDTPPNRNRRPLIIASVTLIALLGLIGLIVLAQNFYSSGESENLEQFVGGEPPAGSDDGAAAPDDGTETSTASGEADPEETDETAPEIAEATPSPPRQINAVWDQISDRDWSTKPLSYFYPYVRRANQADLLSAAANGNADAQTLAGIGYHVGLLGKVDHGLELRRYLQPACNSGQGRACTLLGVHYRSNRMGVTFNNQTAASYYQQGCRLGNQTGCNYAAVRSSFGEGVPQDLEGAASTFRQSCDGGSGYGCFNLAEAYVFGRGVPQDIARARELWAQGQRLISPAQYPDFDQAFIISPSQR